MHSLSSSSTFALLIMTNIIITVLLVFQKLDSIKELVRLVFRILLRVYEPVDTIALFSRCRLKRALYIAFQREKVTVKLSPQFIQ
jgi:hypothetical protein